MTNTYDALLLVSFGGPERIEEVMPFLRNVVRGRNVSDERLREVAHHYEQFGGVSPINEQNRQLIAALKEEFAARNCRLPIYWGNRNWHPMLADAVRQMKADGVRRALAFVTSAYASYSGCRQYLEDIERARDEVGEGAPEIEKLRLFYNHPQFIKAAADRLTAAMQDFAAGGGSSESEVIFTAHSIPSAMAHTCDYEKQLRETCALVAGGAHATRWQLVFQSRSGPPSQPWLEPDVCDYLRESRKNGTRSVVVMPIGFISDHMEVKYDLDTEARAVAQELGMGFVRASTVGTHPSFVNMIYQLVQERVLGEEKLTIGECGVAPDFCAPDCCRYAPVRPVPVSSEQTN